MISILDEQTRLPSLAGALRERAERVLAHLGLEAVEVSTLLCDDPAIQALNKEWRGLDKPTDVLSFPLEDEDDPALLDPEMPVIQGLPDEAVEQLGDIIISVDTCIRQAQEWNHTDLDEATRLWIHGLLHLCGYDHETPEEAAEMLAKEEALLQLFDSHPITPLVTLPSER